MRIISCVIIDVLIFVLCSAQDLDKISVMRIKYKGGGDWYGNKTTFINLFDRLNRELKLHVPYKEVSHEIMDEQFLGSIPILPVKCVVETARFYDAKSTNKCN